MYHVEIRLPAQGWQPVAAPDGSWLEFSSRQDAADWADEHTSGRYAVRVVKVAYAGCTR